MVCEPTPAILGLNVPLVPKLIVNPAKLPISPAALSDMVNVQTPLGSEPSLSAFRLAPANAVNEPEIVGTDGLQTVSASVPVPGIKVALISLPLQPNVVAGTPGRSNKTTVVPFGDVTENFKSPTQV